MQKISKLVFVTMLGLSACVQAAQVSPEDLLAIEVNRADDVCGLTPFIKACFMNEKPDEALRLLSLTKSGTETLLVDVNKSDTEGRTALMMACLFGRECIVQKLLALRKPGSDELLVDVCRQDDDGLTAFMQACASRNEQIIQMFLEFKKPGSDELVVDVNMQDDNGNTALIQLCKKCNNSVRLKRIFWKLLENGADISLQNIARRSALDVIQSPSLQEEMKAVFDALRPEVTSDEVKDAYREFQKGKPAKLQAFMKQYRCQQQDSSCYTYQSFIPSCLVPQDVSQRLDKFYGVKEQLAHFFKTESIKPLLKWLIHIARDENTLQGLGEVLHAVEAEEVE